MESHLVEVTSLVLALALAVLEQQREQVEQAVLSERVEVDQVVEVPVPLVVKRPNFRNVYEQQDHSSFADKSSCFDSTTALS